MRKSIDEQKEYCSYVLEIAEKVQFRHCERSEAISLIRFDKSYENAILRAYNISEVTHMGR